MFCSECGTNLTYEKLFCSNCGTKAPENISAINKTLQETAFNGSIKNQTLEVSTKTKIIAIASIFFVGAVFVQIVTSIPKVEDARDVAIRDEVDRKYQLKNISEGRDALDPGTRSVATQKSQEDSQQFSNPSTQQPMIAQKDLGQEYAKNLASQLERSGHPGCQMLAVTIRSIGYGSNPTEIKMRQIDSIVDKAPSICF